MRVVLPALLLLFVLMLAASAVVLIVGRQKRLPASRILFGELICWLTVYLFALIYVTILSRSTTSASCTVNLIPFQELTAIFRQHRYLDLELYLFNSILFLPEGVLICCILNCFKKNSWRRALCICFGTILPIELVQCLTGRGVFDIDDILFNAIGFVIGYLLARTVSKIIFTGKRDGIHHRNF